MRTIYTFLFLIFIGFCSSCDERDIEVFDGTNQIYFEDFYVNAQYPGTEEADSTVASFFFYPDGTNDIKAPLTVLLSGKKLTEDRNFRLRVVEEETTALPAEYSLDSCYTFHAGTVNEETNDIRDIIQIQFHYSERLKDVPNGVRLVVEIVPDQWLKWGQYERVRAKIILTTAAAQPAWWNKEVTENLLGTYSEKKYKYFLNEVDLQAEMSAELIKKRPDRAIQLTLQFKKWLMEQNPAITESDGSLMQVKL